MNIQLRWSNPPQVFRFLKAFSKFVSIKKKKKDDTVFSHKYLNLHTSYGEREQGHTYFTLPTGPSTVPAYCYHSLNVKLISATTSSNPTAWPPPPSPKPGKQAERGAECQGHIYCPATWHVPLLPTHFCGLIPTLANWTPTGESKLVGQQRRHAWVPHVCCVLLCTGTNWNKSSCWIFRSQKSSRTLRWRLAQQRWGQS